MGDNLNANGAAPIAPYVFLSFLFEIVVEFMIYFVLIRIKSRSNLLIYSTGAMSPTATPFHGRPGRCLQGALRLLL